MAIWDVFISHASEDKDSLVRPLAEKLSSKGLKVWYDEFTLTVGDSLRRSIDRGLAQSRFGIVVLSEHFFAKEWPQRELDGLVAREISEGKVILPIWHNVSRERVANFSPVLADRIAIISSHGLETVMNEILRAIRTLDKQFFTLAPEKNDTSLESIKIKSAVSEAGRSGAVIDVKNKRALVHYNKSVDLMKRGYNEKAKIFLQKSIAIDASIAEAHSNLGKLLLNEGKTEDAFLEFQAALELKPELYQAYLNFSSYYLQNNQYEKAEECMLKVCKMNPNNPDLISEVANFYFSAQKFNKAIKYYQRIIEIDPDNFVSYYNLGNCYANLRENRNAIVAFRKAVDIQPNFGMAWNNLGHTLSKEHKFNEAERALEIAKEKDSQNYHPWFSAGHNYLDWEKLEKAIENFQKVVDIKPDFPGGWEGLGEVYELLGQEEESEKYFNKMKQLLSQ